MPVQIPELFEKLRAGDRVALARAITLIESRKEENRPLAARLLEFCQEEPLQARRIGISGSPGVGKSTFIETTGMALIEKGNKVAVLSIDPSSTISGGSILGDKTRMPELAVHKMAFVRPTAAGEHLGGVGEKTREAMLLCEAAGYGHVLVETVGVGQSETDVARMVDCFLLLLLPGSGDDLQGMKRGIVELADLIVINKADGERLDLARQTQRDYRQALRILKKGTMPGDPGVFLVSSLEQTGLEELLGAISDFFAKGEKTGYFYSRRAEQAVYWFDAIAQQHFQRAIFNHKRVKQMHDELRNAVAHRQKSVTLAIQELELCLKDAFQA